MITIYGKNYHVFVCVKTGQNVSSELLDTGLGGPQAVKAGQEEARTISLSGNPKPEDLPDDN